MAKSGRSRARKADPKAPRMSADSQSEKNDSSGSPADDAPPLRSRKAKPEVKVGSRKFIIGRSAAGHELNILPDMPDIRDRLYRPHLRALHPAIYPRIAFSVRNQEKDSSCTGYSLAHVIDFLRFKEVSGDNPARVSSRMLYEMARCNDEWAGSNYEGSSIRGAIKGFFRNGVCTEDEAPDDLKDGMPRSDEWVLTIEMAKAARETRLGAYLRLEPDISDYHAALNETGIIYASAQIHSGWDKPDHKGCIQSAGSTPRGGHAFAIVGYDDEGFWVLNSWGSGWGQNGIARWDYKDWAATVMDAWVLQLGVRAPNAFGAVPRATPSSATGLFSFGEPARADIVGHFVNIDDGRLVTNGKYGSPSDKEMQETVDRLLLDTANQETGYQHLVIYAHGGLNSLPDEAQRIATWKRHKVFADNGIYNFHLMWGSGFIDEAFGKLSGSPSLGRAGGKFTDWLFEAGLGKETGSYAWRNMKQDARIAFDEKQKNEGYDGGFRGLSPLLGGLDKGDKPPMLHVVGHSAGSIVLGYLLSALGRFNLSKVKLGSIHLMAPACTVEFFNTHYKPYLAAGSALQDKLYIYNLKDSQEEVDTVSAGIPLLPSYSHSLLYLVSRAYEDKPNTPIAGMELFSAGLPKSPRLVIDFSKNQFTKSTSHGGFDNDPATITAIMSRIRKGELKKKPTQDELSGY